MTRLDHIVALCRRCGPMCWCVHISDVWTWSVEYLSVGLSMLNILLMFFFCRPKWERAECTNACSTINLRKQCQKRCGTSIVIDIMGIKHMIMQCKHKFNGNISSFCFVSQPVQCNSLCIKCQCGRVVSEPKSWSRRIHKNVGGQFSVCLCPVWVSVYLISISVHSAETPWPLGKSSLLKIIKSVIPLQRLVRPTYANTIVTRTQACPVPERPDSPTSFSAWNLLFTEVC